MLRRSIFCALVFVLTIGAEPVNTPKSQCEELLDTVLPFAEKMLSTHGEFFPFGASMKSDGTIALAAAYEGNERPPSQPLIDMLHKAFHADAMKGAIRASALVYDVLVIPPGTNTKTDAIAVELDHRDKYSTVVYFPYSIDEGKVTLQAPFANQGTFGIF